MADLNVKITCTISSSDVDSANELLERLQEENDFTLLVDDGVEEISCDLINIDVEETD